MANPVITRFAPSPTGALHVGGARTALFNWAYARRHGGQFLLRIEDTDRARSTEAAEQGILRDLDWLGLDWDNRGNEPRQSQRLDLYNAAIEKLQSAGLTTTEDNGAVRFTTPGKDITVDDQIRGSVTFPAAQIEDFIIRKADGYPTYHLAVVVDDADMRVTHVLRGQEHLNNTPKHIALQDALGLPRPTYAHFGLIFNPDGSKMSKRDKAKAARKAAKETRLLSPAEIDSDLYAEFLDKQNDEPAIALAIAEALGLVLPEIDVDDFRLSGYLPAVLCNYLALLGWNPGNDVEKFDNAFLKQHFDLDRVNKGDSKFDRDKLASFNAHSIKEMPQNQLIEQFWSAGADKYPTLFSGVDDERFASFCEAYRERSRTLTDPLTQGAFFFDDKDAIKIDDQARKKVMDKNDGEGWKMLEVLKSELEQLPEEDFGTAAHEKIKELAERLEVGMGKIAQPLRVAISGNTVTPPLDATLDILGKAKTIRRINLAIPQRHVT